MKNKLNSLLAISGSLLLTLTRGLAQGTLTPPGAPAPTMITLAQIEPRTPISSLPYTITNSGSYYLTTNFTGFSGLTIAASNVTLDLNGFVLQGAVKNSGFGIFISGWANITIRNGAITGWNSYGISARSDTQGLVVEGVRASANAYGMYLASTGFVVRDCVCQSNSYDGIYASGANYTNRGFPGGLISGCTLVGNKSNGLECYNSTVKDCQSLSNNISGIFACFSQVTGCRIDACGTNYSSYGINAQDCDISHCLIQNCVNGITGGMTACSIIDCSVNYCGTGIQAGPDSIVHNCRVSSSGANGIEANSCTVSGCSINYSTYNGIIVKAPGSRIIGNHLNHNNTINYSFYAGILLADSNNYVEDNHVTLSGRAGINADNYYNNSTNNVIVKNIVQGNGTNNYLGTTNSDFGPIGTAANATSPWANISQ